MKRFTLTAAIMLMLFANQSAAADVTLRKLIEMAKANPGSKVVVMHERGENTEGELVDVSGDVFCVARPIPDSEKRVEYCYPYTVIERIGKLGTGAHSNHTPIWVAGGK